MSVQRRVAKDRLVRRPKVGLTLEEEARLKHEAAAAGTDVSSYMRQTLLARWGEAPPPRARRNKGHDALLHTLNQIYVQMRRDGSNLNQLARQANSGIVAISRAEVTYLTNFMQTNLSAVKSAVERLLA